VDNWVNWVDHCTRMEREGWGIGEGTEFADVAVARVSRQTRRRTKAMSSGGIAESSIPGDDPVPKGLRCPSLSPIRQIRRRHNVLIYSGNPVVRLEQYQKVCSRI
jgi:hypothetical protein